MRFYRYRLATLVVIAALTGVIFNAVQNSGPALGYPSGTQVPTFLRHKLRIGFTCHWCKRIIKHRRQRPAVIWSRQAPSEARARSLGSVSRIHLVTTVVCTTTAISVSR
jgi:hypothetical protein